MRTGFSLCSISNREKPVFISWDPCNENRIFPVGNTTQGNPCSHYRDGFAVYLSLFLHLNNGVKGFLKEHYNFHSSIFSKYFLGNICIIIITQSSCEKVHAKKENKKDFQKINEIIVPSRGQEATSLSFKKGCIKVKVGVSL